MGVEDGNLAIRYPPVERLAHQAQAHMGGGSRRASNLTRVFVYYLYYDRTEAACAQPLAIGQCVALASLKQLS
jgi:hypothetical protein